MYLSNQICSNAVDLMKLINRLNKQEKHFVMNETKGIYGETLVKVEWDWISDEEES